LRGLEAIQRELENKRRELVINAVESLRDQINRTVKRMLAKRKLKGVKEELERVRSLAVDVGLEAVASSDIDPLIETVEDPERIEAEFGSDILIADLMGLTRRRVGQILELEGISNANNDKRRELKPENYPVIARLILGGEKQSVIAEKFYFDLTRAKSGIHVCFLYEAGCELRVFSPLNAEPSFMIIQPKWVGRERERFLSYANAIMDHFQLQIPVYEIDTQGSKDPLVLIPINNLWECSTTLEGLLLKLKNGDSRQKQIEASASKFPGEKEI